MRVKEMPPKEYAEFHGIDLQAEAEKSEKGEGLFKLLAKAPKTFWTVGLVQFFCWAAFLYMWTYTNGAIAVNVWNTTDTASAASRISIGSATITISVYLYVSVDLSFLTYSIPDIIPSL